MVDANILLYAEDRTSPHHVRARIWWDTQLSGATHVCFSWSVLTAFIRISTNRRAFRQPLIIEDALERVQSWLDQPCVRIIHPTEKHWSILHDLLKQTQATANLVTDAHLAVLAIEHGCEFYSSDADYSRFPKLKWFNPLALPKR